MQTILMKNIVYMMFAMQWYQLIYTFELLLIFEGKDRPNLDFLTF